MNLRKKSCIFFLAPCMGRRGIQNAVLDWARDCTCLNAFALTYISIRRISFNFWRFFFFFKFLWKEKKFVFHTRELKYKFFFHKLKTESSLHMRVKFYSSSMCITHKNFKLFIKLLLKISFFAKFRCFLWFIQN